MGGEGRDGSLVDFGIDAGSSESSEEDSSYLHNDE